MDKLSAFQFNNTRKLFDLAKKLNQNKFFDTFLTEQQFKVLNHILQLDSFELWSNFLEGNCYIKFLDDGEEGEEVKDEESSEEKDEEVAKGAQDKGSEESENESEKGEGIDQDDVDAIEEDPKDPDDDVPDQDDEAVKDEVVQTVKSESEVLGAPLEITKKTDLSELPKRTEDSGSEDLNLDNLNPDNLNPDNLNPANLNPDNLSPDDLNPDKDSSQNSPEPSSPEEPTEPELILEDGAKMVSLLALHIRYLLWEKAINFYYTSKSLDESIYNIEEVSDEYGLIDSLDVEEEESPKDVAVVVETREENDDYDDDEEEEEVAKPDIQPIEETETILTFNDDNQAVLEIPTSIFKTQADEKTKKVEEETSKQVDSDEEETVQAPAPTNSALEDQERLIKEFNKVYHNFEYDRETLIKRRRLEQSDLRLENSKGGSTTNANGPGGRLDSISNTSSSALNINLGTASTTLQLLLNRILQKRDAVPLNDFELRSLFMDVRKNRGKWASDDRVGQEELYEACEKVVMELRSHTEHSTPFLNKVAKRDAPNYTLIIKKPMDLNTVMKKLKTLSYQSKQEFVDDLMLIWSNCLAYNADPKHFIRTHAIAMQKKTMKLAPTIPNITIRSRADIEKEEEEELKQATPVTTKSKATTTTPSSTISGVSEKLQGISGKSMKKGRKRSRQDVIKTETDPNSPVTNGDLSDFKDISETPAPEIGNTSVDEDEDEDDDNEILNGEASNNGVHNVDDEQEEEDLFDPELQAWKTLTSKSRANYCAQRSELFDENYHLKDNAAAILRKSTEMKNFNQYLKNSEVIAKSSNLLENDEPYLLEYDVTGGIPGFNFKGLDEEEEEMKEQKLADVIMQQVDGDASKLKSGFVLPLDSGLNKIYYENINQMQEIRKICFKISLIRQMQTQQFVHHTQMKQPEIEAIKEVDVDSASNLPNHDPYNQDVQFSVLRRNVAKIAMQTGFETAEPFAINTLTQLAEKYLGNLIKSLKMHSESNSSNQLDNKEMLLLSLLENGVNKPDDLYTYVKERIFKQHDKLNSLRDNLSNFLKELLRPGLENFNERSFDDNSEQFMTGDFSNDLGDDFFGFKLLGLDKEFKLMSTSIPIYLLHSRLHNSYATTGSTSKRNKHEDLNEYVQQKLIASDINDQIGLLRPFYNSLYEKSKALFIKNQKKKGESTELPENNALLLVEDEELPQKQRNIRPRLPPTGRITSIKKKIVANAFFIPEDEELNGEVSLNGADFDEEDDEELRLFEDQLREQPKSEDEPLSLFTSPRKISLKSEG